MSEIVNEVKVQHELTPNPDSLKFLINRLISESSFDFSSAQEAHMSPLASKIFGFPWAAGVFIGPDFVTVRKQNWVEWEILAEPLAGLIQEHIETGLPVIDAEAVATAEQSLSEDPTIRQIQVILNEEIRPAVAMDGGDVVFHSYEDNVVYLHMQGSCAGCPSSMMTLKMGIETRLKESVPEIKEVISLQ